MGSTHGPLAGLPTFMDSALWFLGVLCFQEGKNAVQEKYLDSVSWLGNSMYFR